MKRVAVALFWMVAWTKLFNAAKACAVPDCVPYVVLAFGFLALLA